jgi:hypothetical protein
LSVGRTSELNASKIATILQIGVCLGHGSLLDFQGLFAAEYLTIKGGTFTGGKKTI